MMLDDDKIVLEVGTMQGFTMILPTPLDYREPGHKPPPLHPRHQYQRCKPITSKNIGKNLLKGGKVTYAIMGEPNNGEREKARRLKQKQRQAEKAK